MMNLTAMGNFTDKNETGTLYINVVSAVLRYVYLKMNLLFRYSVLLNSSKIVV